MIVKKFTAEWCGPCKLLAPILDKVAKEKDIEIIAIDIGDSPEEATKHNVRGIPTIILCEDDGTELKRHVGNAAKAQLEAFLDV